MVIMWYYLFILILVPLIECGVIFPSTVAPTLANKEICHVVPVFDRIKKGNCFYNGKIPRCRGLCYSSDGLEDLIIENRKQKNTCRCCMPIHFKIEQYKFDCYSDGKLYSKDMKLRVPSACRCSTCSSQEGGDADTGIKPDFLMMMRRKRVKYFF